MKSQLMSLSWRESIEPTGGTPVLRSMGVPPMSENAASRMYRATKFVCAFAVLLGGWQLGAAPVTLHDFTSFLSPNTFFVGDWEATGSVAGSDQPRGTFSQGSGAYSFAGGSNDEFSGAFYFFTAPIDISGLSLLGVSAQLLSDNTASTFTISLFDSLGESAFAVFSTADFGGLGVSTISSTLTFTAGFNAADLSSFYFTGGAFLGTDVLSLSLDELALSAPPPPPGVAVSEAANAGMLAAASLVLLALVQRSRRTTIA